MSLVVTTAQTVTVSPTSLSFAYQLGGSAPANQTLKVVFENDVIAIVDGQFGFGQVMGEEAMRLGIDKSRAGRLRLKAREDGLLDTDDDTGGSEEGNDLMNPLIFAGTHICQNS